MSNTAPIYTTPTPQAYHGPSDVFHSGEGVSRNFISCANDPLDLRPAADIIVAKIYEALREVDKNTPVVVLMGECHIMPSHTKLQQLVATRLLNAGQDFTFSYENENNFVEKIATALDTPFPRYLRYRASDYDLDGKAILSGYMGFHQTHYTPVSNHDLLAFCYQNSIKFQFNDAAKKENIWGSRIIDKNAPYVREALTKYDGPIKDLHTTAPDGIAIRNSIMVERALEYAQKLDVNLVLQKCGLAHTLGDAAEEKHYKDSLSARFKEAGARVITVLPVTQSYNFGINIFPKEAFGAIQNSIVIADMDEEEFTKKDDPASEARHNRNLSEHSGGEISSAPYDEGDSCQVDFKRHAARILEKARQDYIRDHPVLSFFRRPFRHNPFAGAGNNCDPS